MMKDRDKAEEQLKKTTVDLKQAVQQMSESGQLTVEDKSSARTEKNRVKKLYDKLRLEVEK